MKNKNSKNKSNNLLVTVGAVAGAVALGLSIYSVINQSSLNTRINELNALVIAQSEMQSKAQDDLVAANNQTIKDYIMENPKVMIKSIAKLRFEQEQLEKQEQVKNRKSLDAQIFNVGTDPVLGNPNGKHVVVEFIDNNCGYCKALYPVLNKFIQIDPEAKVIVKEYPIFDNQESSHYSALVGTAIWLTVPSKYEEFHKLAMTSRGLTNKAVDSFVDKIGIPKDTLLVNLEKAKELIQANRTLGAQLGISGTPTLYSPNQEAYHGGFTAEQLMQKFQ